MKPWLLRMKNAVSFVFHSIHFEILYKISFSRVCITAERLLNRSARPFANSFVRVKQLESR
jgi:hypothetical protein